MIHNCPIIIHVLGSLCHHGRKFRFPNINTPHTYISCRTASAPHVLQGIFCTTIGMHQMSTSTSPPRPGYESYGWSAQKQRHGTYRTLNLSTSLDFNLWSTSESFSDMPAMQHTPQGLFLEDPMNWGSYMTTQGTDVSIGALITISCSSWMEKNNLTHSPV